MDVPRTFLYLLIIEKQGIETFNPTFPDNVEAKIPIWLPFIDELCVDEQTVLVGWSSGAAASMRYGEEHKILGSILIGASYTDLGDEGEKISGYYDDPWQWEKIKANQKWIAQFGSIHDPVIPIEENCYVHEMLDTEYCEFPDKQHFG